MKKSNGIKLDEKHLAQIKGGNNPYGIEEVDPAYLGVSFKGGETTNKNFIINWLKSHMN